MFGEFQVNSVVILILLAQELLERASEVVG
jgi:hypothetical protein